MARKIEVIIDEMGEVTIETSGFKGGACAVETAKLMEAMGGTVVTEKKPEFFDKCTVAAGVKIKA
mgnify:CR=1 FL=1